MKKTVKKKLLSYVYIISLGILSSFSLPPYNFFLINFFTFSALFIFIVNQRFSLSKREYFFYGWMFGFGYFISSLYWITISLTFDQNFKILIPIALVLIPLFLGMFYGLATYFFSYFKRFSNISLVLAFSGLISILEYLRGNILSGFPWNLISFSLSDFSYLLQTLSLIGTYSFNLFCLTLFVLPSLFYLNKGKYDKYFVISFGLLLISGVVFGHLNLQKSKETSFKKKIKYGKK